MNKQPLTYGSLFSGIGGIDLGLDRAGFQCKFQVEIDDYAQKVLAKHWPNVTRYGDIRTVGSHNLPSIDMLVGGFPCQPHSLAGKRKASEDERDLWEEFYRIICELRPSWVLAENVPGLLSSENGRFFGRVLRDLAASGFNAEWQVLSAAALGAPHIRERIFIVAYPTDQQDWRIQQRGMESDSATSNQNVAYTGSERRQQKPRSSSSNESKNEGRPTLCYNQFECHGESRTARNVAYSNIKRLEIGQIFGNHAQQELTSFKRDCSTGSGQWAVESSVCRMADGVSSRVDRLKCLGNAVIPQIAEYIGRCILATVAREEVA